MAFVALVATGLALAVAVTHGGDQVSGADAAVIAFAVLLVTSSVALTVVMALGWRWPR